MNEKTQIGIDYIRDLTDDALDRICSPTALERITVPSADRAISPDAVTSGPWHFDVTAIGIDATALDVSAPDITPTNLLGEVAQSEERSIPNREDVRSNPARPVPAAGGAGRLTAPSDLGAAGVDLPGIIARVRGRR